ncbi:MAG TPA: protein phosphatase 2C domain-containing protein [Pseudonocardiaceae bacterium]|jgi:protein phosphatase|nr:protein phosphatase 2C domain-containing protein [Pseudonocardiaceae bacterium]
MTDSEVLQLRSVAHTDPGLHRSNNEDSGYVSARLLVVADGMGGHAYGEVASSTAVSVLAELDKSVPWPPATPGSNDSSPPTDEATEEVGEDGEDGPTEPGPPSESPTDERPADENPTDDLPAAEDPAAEDPVAQDPVAQDLADEDPAAEDPDLLEALGGAIREIGDRLTSLAQQDSDLATMGTTVTAFMWDGGMRLAIAHIGDSRAYLLRDDQFGQLTRDHTLVQSLVDEGKLTPEQAAVHPRRSVLMRALQSGGTSEPDLYYWQAQPGDRYLLCSDGLSDVIPDELIGQVLASVPDPDDAAATFIDLAKQGGGPDNITCVIADLVASSAAPMTEPLIIGAAEANVAASPQAN